MANSDASDDLKISTKEVAANPCSRGPGRTAYKNVFGLSVSVMLLFCAFQGLQSLQSSINSSGGLGLVSLAILYVFFVIAGFVTPGIVKILGTKYALMGGMVCHFIYVASNYYSDWYTLIPSSILLGFASGPIWAAVSVHLTEIAVKVAPIVKETHQNLIGQFTGILFLFFQLSQIPGNLASSLILLYSESNVTSENCTNFSATMIEHKYIYILISVFLLFDIAAIVTLALTVDQLPRETPFRLTKNKFQVFLLTPLIDTFKVLVNWKMFFVGFMFIMAGLEQSFIFGTFTQVSILLYSSQKLYLQYAVSEIRIRVCWCQSSWLYDNSSWVDQCCNECTSEQASQICTSFCVCNCCWPDQQWTTDLLGHMEANSQLSFDIFVSHWLGNC